MCKNMKATYDNLCDYGRDCANIYFTLYGFLQELIKSVMEFECVTYIIYKVNYYLRKLGQKYLSTVTKSLYFLKGNLEYFIAQSMLFVCLDIKLSDTP